MTTVIIGSEGNIGRRLMAAFPGAIGIDRARGADIVADLATIDYDAPAMRTVLATAESLIHVATSADPNAPDAVHYQAVTNTARLLAACQAYPVPRIMLPSSDWAEPRDGWVGINTYGHSKRAFETMAAMYRHSTGKTCTALRIGWVAGSLAEVERAEPWLQANHWPDARLIAEVQAALGLPAHAGGSRS